MGRTSSRKLLMVSLSQFYSNKANMAAILPYINGNGAISLRMIDWFVTNYVKMNNVILPQPGGRFINVYVSYRMQLKAYSKQQFDPFRRRDRVAFHYEPDQTVETTVGQLNFFRWMLQHRILQYVQDNVEAIERAMLDHDAIGKGGSGNSGSVSTQEVEGATDETEETKAEAEAEASDIVIEKPNPNSKQSRTTAAVKAKQSKANQSQAHADSENTKQVRQHSVDHGGTNGVLTVRGRHMISFE